MQTRQTTGLPFMKMHGLGNDFVVVDLRMHPAVITPVLARALADRNRGVGFDQLATIEAGDDADLVLIFYNADGSRAAACGNATRCIAAREMKLTGRGSLTIRTDRGLLSARDEGRGITAVNMGQPQLQWDEIPLAEPMDTLELPLGGTPTATGMGNPHCTFFVPDAEAVDLARLGAETEHHQLFPERANVQVVSLLGEDRLRMRVWERGVGITLASGSSSCAAAVAAARRGLTGRKVQLRLDGGMMSVDWRADGVWMAGTTAHVFDGVLTDEFFARLD